MQWSEFELVIPLAGLSINVMCQVISYRFRITSKLLNSIVIGFFLGFVSITLLELHSLNSFGNSFANHLGYYLVNLTTYAALGYGYFHFINLGETARRVRLLREIIECPEGLSHQDLLKRYDAQSMFRLRLDRLLNKKQVISKNGKLMIGSKSMLNITKILILLRKILMGTGR